MAKNEQNWIVGITDKIVPPPEIENTAFPEADIRVLPDWRESKENIAQWKEVDALLAWHYLVDPSTVQLLDRCRIVVRFGVGYEKINIKALSERDIVFCNTPDYGTEEVADTACAMILNLHRKIASHDRECRYFKSGWQDNVLAPIERTSETSVGIIGVGRIGTAVINRLKAFGFKIFGYDPYQPSGHEKAIGYIRTTSVAELLEKSQFVSFHCPLTDETRGMVDGEFLSQMRPASSLVNTARGGIISDLSLIEDALRSGHLASAALDVLPDEPPKDDPLILAWRQDEPWLRGRLLINPHTAFYSEKAWYEMRYKTAETARLYLLDGKIRNRITE